MANQLPHEAARNDAPYDSRILLEQVGWVRNLARRMVRDHAAAEDLAQDALAVALRGSPHEPGPLRRWLATVVRNLGRTRVRGEERRLGREARSARADEAPSTLELVERAATQRALVGAVLELDEPYRSVVLLRSFEGLTNEEIARRMGTSASTVGTRLARAHARLREKWLAREGGDERRLAALVALAGWPPVEPALAGSFLLPAVVATGVVGLTLWGFARAARGDGSEAVHAPALVASVVVPENGATAAPPVESAEAGREPLIAFVAAARAPAPAAHEHPPGPALVGRVIDVDGRGVAGLALVRLAGGPGDAGVPVFGEPFASLADGRFEAAEPEVLAGACPVARGCTGPVECSREARTAPGSVVARAPGWTTLYAGEVTPVGDGDPLVVVARTAAIGGVVVDEGGRPVGGARVVLRNPMARLLELGLVLDASIEVQFVAVTDADGRFRLDEAPRLDGQRLEVTHDALVPGQLVEVPGDAREDMRVVLRARDEALLLRGRVTDLRGEPVPGALVSRGGVVSTAGADGLYVMQAVDPRLAALGGAGDVLRAVAPGVGSGEVRVTPDAGGAVTGTVDVVLDQPPLAISGRVVDEDGLPVAGVMLAPIGRTQFGLRRCDHEFGWRDCTAEEVLGASATWSRPDGSFTLRGLAAREYRIEVLQSPALRRVVSAPLAAGSTDVEIVFATPPVGRIAGRAVDRRGAPVPGVRIAVSRELVGGDLSIGSSAETDDAGRFAIDGVALDDVFLRIEGEGVAPEIRREVEPGTGELELVVGLRRHVQLDWGDWAAGGCTLGVVAGDGNPLSFMNLGGLSVTPLERLDPYGGLSPTYVVSDLAAEVVMVDVDGVELFRVPLTLPAGEVELVRLPCIEHVLGQPCPDHAHHDRSR